jgi:hypothetical protein
MIRISNVANSPMANIMYKNAVNIAFFRVVNFSYDIRILLKVGL